MSLNGNPESSASELGCGIPYGQYPTNTRFERADYKYYKTLADSAEFAQHVRASPAPPPPPPPPHTRRPVTAHPTGSGAHRRNHPQPQRQHHQRQPPASRWREPEPGWRPVFPEPDLSSATHRSHDARADAPDACVVGDSPAPPPPSPPPPPPPPPVEELPAELPQQQRMRRPLTAPPVAGTPKLSLQQQQQLHRHQHQALATPLMLVDFSETDQPDVAQQKQQPQPQLHQLSMAQPAAPAAVTPAAAARFFRPKTAPAKVASEAQLAAAAAASDSRGLLVLGRGLRVQSAAAKQAASAGSADSVNQLAEAYDRALAVHGWRMEVPGDPYRIKRQYIPERKPINVTVPEPTVKPLPPRLRRTNRFTFFHTTMPRVVMSFDIHPNFTSEQYSKARAALVKQGKWDFRYRDFSFMY